MRLLLVLLATLAVTPATAEARWRWPVRGDVVTPFVTAANPFAPGQHRGIDVAARPGASVIAPCSGTVRFTGRVPGRGHGVTIACGNLIATVLELATTTVRRGTPITAGTRIGTVAASHVQLGARQVGRRHGYIDPLTLLAEAPAPPPLAAPPVRSPERRQALRRPPPPAAFPAASPVDAATSRAAEAGAASPAGSAGFAASAGRPIPLAAWAGLGLLAAAMPVGVRRRRERRARRYDVLTAR